MTPTGGKGKGWRLSTEDWTMKILTIKKNAPKEEKAMAINLNYAAQLSWEKLWKQTNHSKREKKRLQTWAEKLQQKIILLKRKTRNQEQKRDRGRRTRTNQILWNRTKRHVEYKTHQGDWKQVKTIRDQGRHHTGDTKEGQATWNQRRVTFQNKTWKSRDKNPMTGRPLTALWHIYSKCQLHQSRR